MNVLQFLQRRARELKRDAFTLYFACQDQRTPWYAKFLAALVVGYAFSPIDLIPDFIPVLGLLDDMVIVPLGVLIVCRLIPLEVMEDCRRRAEEQNEHGKPVIWFAAVVILLVWVILAALSFQLLRWWLNSTDLPAT